MALSLPSPITATAIGYSARAVGVHTVLRVVDSTGQTLQYNVNRPLQAGGPDAWYAHVVDLAFPTEQYGGANDGVVHQPITGMALIAGDALQSGLAGVAGFDNVTAWDAMPVTLDPDATTVPAPQGAGDLASRIGVNIHFTSDDRALDIIAAAGFSRVRMDLGWDAVETTPGVYDFSAFDGLVTALASRGMKLHLILDFFNSLYPTSADPTGFAATTVPAFAAVSKAAAAHFVGKGLTYEIWNEPNGSGFWPPAGEAPGQYSLLSSASLAAVHEGDPSALVATGGLAGFDYPFLEGMLDAGGAVGANAIGMHPYRFGGGEEACRTIWRMYAIDNRGRRCQ